MSAQIDLYEFSEGGNIERFTSANYDVEHNGNLYKSIALKRGKFIDKNEISKASIDVSFAIDNPFAQRWLSRITDFSITLTVFTKDSESTFVAWKGRSSGIRPNANDLTITFESVFTSLRRPGLRAFYQRSCRHVLYGRGCKVDKLNFEVKGVVTSIGGSTLRVAEADSYQAGYFAGGLMLDHRNNARFILSNSGDGFELSRPFIDLAEGDEVAFYPGCPRDRETCQNRFNNLDNFGGFPFIPTQNPFDGTPFL